MKYPLALVLALACAIPLHTAEPPNRAIRFDSVRKGMPMKEAKRLLGPPSRTARIVLFRKYTEQWHYFELGGWVEIQYPRGEEPYVWNVFAE